VIGRAGIWRLGRDARRYGAHEPYSYDRERTVPQETAATHIFHFASSADVRNDDPRYNPPLSKVNCDDYGRSRYFSVALINQFPW
jgi:hypothetical protein